jgi:hypothetical protein
MNFWLTFFGNIFKAHLHVYEIESQLIDKNFYDEANRAFTNLFNKYDYRFTEGYSSAFSNMFCNLHKTWLKDSILIDFYVRKLAQAMNSNIILNSYCDCADSITKDAISKHLLIYDSIFISSIDTSLVDKINQMFSKDQLVRNSNDWISMRYVDSLNLIDFNSMLIKYGKFPGVRDVGISAVNNIHLMIDHSYIRATDEWQQWQDILIDGVHSGHFSPYSVAVSIDDAIFDNGIVIDGKWAVKYAKYGTISFKDMLYPVKNIEQANNLRHQIGLPPLECFLKQQNLKYDIEEFKKHIILIEE